LRSGFSISLPFPFSSSFTPYTTHGDAVLHRTPLGRRRRCFHDDRKPYRADHGVPAHGRRTVTPNSHTHDGRRLTDRGSAQTVTWDPPAITPEASGCSSLAMIEPALRFCLVSSSTHHCPSPWRYPKDTFLLHIPATPCSATPLPARFMLTDGQVAARARRPSGLQYLSVCQRWRIHALCRN
jgi:hypothetical protein